MNLLSSSKCGAMKRKEGENKIAYSARSSWPTYWKNGSHISSCFWPGAGCTLDNHCLIFCRFCSKKSLQTIHSHHWLAEIIEMGTGPEPISKTRLFSFTCIPSSSRIPRIKIKNILLRASSSLIQIVQAHKRRILLLKSKDMYIKKKNLTVDADGEEMMQVT